MLRSITFVAIILLSFSFEADFTSVIRQVTLFDEDCFRGNSLKINVNEKPCTDLPPDFARNISSLKLYSFPCVALHSEPNCTGDYLEIPGDTTPYRSYLTKWKFDKKASSVSSCKNPCTSPDVIGPPPSQNDSLSISIYRLKGYRGPELNLNVEGCTLIPREWVGLVRSVKTMGNCVQLYDNPNCLHQPNLHRSIQLRPYFPDFYDLYKWGDWARSEVRSVSHCYYKCDEEKYFVEREMPDLRKENEMTIYDWTNFTGNWKSISVEKCANIPDAWADAIDSIHTHGSNIRIFTGFNCSGLAMNLLADSPNVESFTGQTQLSFENPIPPDGPHIPIKSARICSNMTLEENEMELFSDDKDLNLQTGAEENSPMSIVFLVLGLILGNVIVIAVFIIAFRRRRQIQKAKGQLSRKEIEEFLYGLQMEGRGTGSGISDKKESVMGHDEMNDVFIQHIIYDKSKEIPLSSFQFDTRNLLGKGEFGVVYKGILTKDGGDKLRVEESENHKQLIEIAVKTASSKTNADHLRSIMKEVKVLMYVGSHKRLVEMIGCCTESLEKGQIFILLEYCGMGSLEKFLHSKKYSFRNIVDKGKIISSAIPGDSELGVDNSYHDMTSDESHKLDYFQLLEWCQQIGEGMEYLATKKVIHGDLAARNVLLDKELNAKISDFGLSKRLYYYTEYIKKNEEPLPWRWLSIETLRNMEFTLKSDVWMFGVTCWEIFTLGERPYAGVAWGKDFIQNLVDGLRLRKPIYCTSDCYNLMLDCWEEDPKTRPDFPQILRKIKEMSRDS